jgi:murein biosynthesis integral membrane protein MurJ
LTLASRVTGLVRELMIAALFGASALTDAFHVAFRIPNLFRRLFAEGAFSQAFVPVLAATRAEHGDAPTRALIDSVASALAGVLLLVSVLGVLLAPWLVWAMASGLPAGAQGMDAAVHMTRWMFPYIAFMSMVALSAGILNTWKHFAVPAATPVLLNLSVIGAAWLLAPYLAKQGFESIYALPAGVMIGGVLQLGLQWPALRLVAHLAAPRDPPHPDLDGARPAGRGGGAGVLADQHPDRLAHWPGQRQLAQLCRPLDGVSNGHAGGGPGRGADAAAGGRARHGGPGQLLGHA